MITNLVISERCEQDIINSMKFSVSERKVLSGIMCVLPVN